jgi:hypothetical protein
MQLHVYRAKAQPATRYVVEVGEHRHWVRSSPRRPMLTSCCQQRRIAKNLLVQVYYDMTRVFCRPGKGCKL